MFDQKLTIPSYPINHEDASFRIVGKISNGSGIFGYYNRFNVGKALEEIRASDDQAAVRVEPHHPVLMGKALRSTDVEWIVNNLGELGVKIGDQMFFLFKGESVMYEEPDTDRPCRAYSYRPVEKREFGETCKAPDADRYFDLGDSKEYDYEKRQSGWQGIRYSTANNELAYFETAELKD